MDERTDNTDEPGMPQRLAVQDDPMLDFDFESLVDPDDPGFGSEFDSSTSDLGDDEQSFTTDSDSFEDSESSLYDTDDSNSASDASNIDEKTDQCLRSMTAQFQTEHLRQPKSTQLILTTEVFKLIKSYQRHGSAARLSASVMAYLEGGGFATRKTKREVMEKEVDANGNNTGPMTTTTRMVTERVRLNFVPLPKLDVSPSQVMGVTGSKRKASVDDSKDERKRRIVPTSILGDRFGQIDTAAQASQYSEDGQSPVRPKTAGKVFHSHERDETENENEDAMKIDADMPAGSLAMLKHSYNYNQLLHQPGPQNQPQIPPATPPAPIPPYSIQSHANLTCAPHQYSLTTDQETQSLLLGTNPIVPFAPLSELKITICPIFKQSLPTPCLTAIDRILALHTQAAQKQYASLIDKYTLHPTPSHPHPPQPPAALFRLAITTALHLDLEHLFTPTLEHPMAFDVDTRYLLRDLYDNLSPSELNAAERLLVARAAAVDEEHVVEWWEERNRRLLPMFALRAWVADRDVEAVKLARLRGFY